LAETLFDAIAALKVSTSKVAMHLDKEWRDKLFAQFNNLYDAEEWHEGDPVISQGSFETFLRVMLYQRPRKRPGLGISHRGNLIGAWTNGADRLTLEFFPNDVIHWVLVSSTDEQRERASGEATAARLPAVLSPYRPERWFG
jgi:hypothetical protein